MLRMAKTGNRLLLRAHPRDPASGRIVCAAAVFSAGIERYFSKPRLVI